jgi:predicted ATP-dependent endonuclease of OLD family
MVADLKARKGITATEEGMREQYSHAFNPMINEGFFAEKVVVVEGPSEQYSLPIYADCLQYDLNRNNVSVVHSDGKGQMDRLLRVFSGFNIPTYLWFDGDKKNGNKAVTDKTLELLNLLGEPIEKIEDVKTKISDNYTVLEFTFEDMLEKELADYEKIIGQTVSTLGPAGKPLQHRFIARVLKKRAEEGKSVSEILPKTIIDIIERVKQLSRPSNVLRK